jgi:hypothetical protein
MRFVGEDTPEEIQAKAQALVKDYTNGPGKDRKVARKLLLERVDKRHDPVSKAVKKILEGK